MRLPGGDRAVVPLAKLSQYALSPTHPVGKHKARLFRQLFGLGREHAAEFREALLQAAAEEDASPQGATWGGRIFRLDFVLKL